MHDMKRICFFLCLAFSPLLLKAGTDSTSQPGSLRLKPQRVVRNYIRPSLSFSAFGTAVQPLVPVRRFSQSINDTLQDYRLGEQQLAFITPLYTHTRFGRKDSTDVNTFHLLFTAGVVRIAPQFSGLEHQHVLSRTGVSLRMLYTFGSKFVVFYDASPFVVSDLYRGQRTQQSRFATTAVFNWMVHPGFSLRAGFTRTFRLGNSLVLPTFGVRLGRLDGKLYFTAQYPRFAQLVFQPTPKLSISAYTRAHGGLFAISNSDSALYAGSDRTLQLGIAGLANGLRIEYRTGSNFSFFLSGGYNRNRVLMFSKSFNNSPRVLGQLRPFYNGRVSENAFFVNFGFTVRFGKAKTSAGNYLMYDAFELNNSVDVADGSNMPGNGDIPGRSTKADAAKIQYHDVQDLISDSDLY
ncbi:MAG: hypothetical protein MUC87_16720 [Bacteroidia bacterium]|jgi:hypothetical protein|nr:hypothetical protein [Bacteroidia bacterium]